MIVHPKVPRPPGFSEGSIVNRPELRGGSVCLNSVPLRDKWISAAVMPPPELAAAG